MSVLLLPQTYRLSKFCYAEMVFPQPARKGRFTSTGPNKEVVGDCLGICYSARRLSQGPAQTSGLLTVGVDVLVGNVG